MSGKLANELRERERDRERERERAREREREDSKRIEKNKQRSINTLDIEWFVVLGVDQTID